MILTIFAAAFAVGASAQSFNQLDQCADMAAMVQAARTDDHACRPPRSDIGRALALRLKERSDLCFFDAPIATLKSFECVQTRGFPAIECLRASPGDTLKKIRSQFRGKYDQVLNAYMLAASACPYSNGRASPAPAGLTDFALFGWIAKSQFAVGVQTGVRVEAGGDSRGDGAIVHGFASTDPQAPNTPGWIEYLVVQGQACRASNCSYPSDDNGVELERADGWIVTHESLEETTRQFNRQAVQSNVPVRVAMESYTLSRAPIEVQTPDDLTRVEQDNLYAKGARETILQRWISNGRQLLVDDRFRPATAKELEKAGLTPVALQAMMDRQVPFSRRVAGNQVALEMLIKESGTGCFHNGAVIVGLFASNDAILTMGIGLLDCKYRASGYLDKVSDVLRIQ